MFQKTASINLTLFAVFIGWILSDEEMNVYARGLESNKDVLFSTWGPVLVFIGITAQALSGRKITTVPQFLQKRSTKRKNVT